jgi:hypothetical protein
MIQGFIHDSFNLLTISNPYSGSVMPRRGLRVGRPL